MKRFIVRFILGTAGAWLASIVIPGIASDGSWQSFVLMGFFIAIGEVILYLVRGGAALLLFFVPRPLRNFGLRMLVVAIAVGLVSGFDLAPPISSQLIGLAGTSIIYSLLFLLPFSS